MEKVSENFDCPNGDTSRKRRNVDATADGEPAPKILIEEAPVGVLQFSDEILMEIFRYLDGNALHYLQQTCYRFYHLIRDTSLWKMIDLTSEQLPLSFIKSRLTHLHSQTESVKIRGMTETYPSDKWNNPTLSSSLLTTMAQNCELLQVLEIYSAFINFDTIQINDFPCNLKRLIFDDCSVRWPKTTPSFFTGMDIHFTSLEELGVRNCGWFEPYNLMIFSKIPCLRWLSVKGCNNLKDFVPYGSIAARFGFKKLQYLDVRETPITDSDLQCFNCVITLKELYLECPHDMRRDSDLPLPQLPPQSNAARAAASVAVVLRPQRDEDPLPNIELIGPPLHDEEEEHDEEFAGQNRFVLNRAIPRSRVIVLSVRQDANGGNLVQGDIRDLHPEVQRSLENFCNLRERYNHRIIDRALRGERRVVTNAPTSLYPISDRSICSFGCIQNPAQPGMVCIRMARRLPNNSLERLVIRHYKRVTDVSLRHLVQCSPNLIYLDLTGTSVTKDGIEKFKNEKPECQIIFDD